MPVPLVRYVVLPFRRLPLEVARPFENCVPLYDLKIAAGQFSEEQQVPNVEWVELPDCFRPQRGLFVAQVVGESMNRRIPNGAWCLFRQNPVGSRQGKVVLVELFDRGDIQESGHYTVKIYESRKQEMPDGTWLHNSIVLRPDSTLPRYEPIVLREDQAEEVKVVAELG